MLLLYHSDVVGIGVGDAASSTADELALGNASQHSEAEDTFHAASAGNGMI